MTGDLWWDTSSDNGPVVCHAEVFGALDALASADDGLGTLSALASILDRTDGVVDVRSSLRSAAEKTVSRSEAALFGGYLFPESGDVGDAGATAGRLLRAHRDRDLPAMVEAANENPLAFSDRPFVGVLTLVPLLAYEMTRDESDVALKDDVVNFLEGLGLPLAGVEDFLFVLLGGVIGNGIGEIPELSSELDVETSELLTGISESVLANRPLADSFLVWALRIEAEMNETRPSSRIPQCGAELSSDFAAKVSSLAAVFSETPRLRRFRNREVDKRSAYGLWQEWLRVISPSGFTHRTLGSFTPTDLVQAIRRVPESQQVNRLARCIWAQTHSGPWFEELGIWSIGRRYQWLNGLARLLDGQIEPIPLFVELQFDGVLAHRPGGVAGPSVIAQMTYLVLIVQQDLLDLVPEDDIGVNGSGEKQPVAEDCDQMILLLAERLSMRIAEALRLGELAEDELRGLQEWVELIAEFGGSGVRQGPEGFDVTDVGDDPGQWFSHLGWWLKARGWKLPKERPVIEPIPEPAAVVTREQPEVGVEPGIEVVEFEPDQPVRIVFVGGDERQVRVDAAVGPHVQGRYGDMVTVEWVHIDWSSRWKKDADKVLGMIDRGADVVVLRPMTRTGMGEHLRRASGERGVSWVSCTGTGRGMAIRAIDEAVQVVCRQRLAG